MELAGLHSENRIASIAHERDKCGAGVVADLCLEDVVRVGLFVSLIARNTVEPMILISNLLLASLTREVVSRFTFTKTREPRNTPLNLKVGAFALFQILVILYPGLHLSDRAERFFLLFLLSILVSVLLLPPLRQLLHIVCLGMSALLPPLHDRVDYRVVHLEHNVGDVGAGVQGAAGKF